MNNGSLASRIEVLRERVLRLRERAGRTPSSATSRITPKSFDSLLAALDRLDPHQVREDLERRVDERTAELRDSERSLRKLNKSLHMVSECNDALVHAANEADLLAHLCRTIVNVGGYRQAWVGFREDDAGRTLRPVACAGIHKGYLDQLRMTWADAPRGRMPAARAVRTAQPVVVSDVLHDKGCLPWRAAARKSGYASVAAMPLMADGRVLGALSIHAAEPDAFDGAEVRLLKELADDLAYGLMALRNRAARSLAEQALKEQSAALESERLRLFSVLNVLPGFVLLHGADHTVQFANHRFVDLFGDPLGRPCYDVLRGRDKPCEVCPAAEVYATGQPREWEWTAAGGRAFHIWGYPFSEVDGTLSILQLGIDITERKEMEKEILDAGAEEQQRIGRDLHDVLGQNLTGVAYMSKALAQRLTAAGSLDADQAQQIASLCGQAVTQARAISHGLCPIDLTAEGLVGALREMADSIGKLFGIPCAFNCPERSWVFASTVAGHLYHIVREAVTNATKHARPKHIWVNLGEADGHVVLSVRDNGIGLPVQTGATRGMGLRIMRYRANIIGATLTVGPGPGGGTMIVCKLPSGRLGEEGGAGR